MSAGIMPNSPHGRFIAPKWPQHASPGAERSAALGTGPHLRFTALKGHEMTRQGCDGQAAGPCWQGLKGHGSNPHLPHSTIDAAIGCPELALGRLDSAPKSIGAVERSRRLRTGLSIPTFPECCGRGF